MHFTNQKDYELTLIFEIIFVALTDNSSILANDTQGPYG